MSNRIPRYLKHANGQGYCKLKGRYFYFGKHGTDESAKRYREFLARLENGGLVDVPKVIKAGGRRIVELIEQYEVFAAGRYRKDGKPSKEYRGMMDALLSLDALFGLEFGNDFGPAKLEQLQHHLIAQDYARTTINHRIGRLKRFWRWCCKKELVRPGLHHELDCVDGLHMGFTDARESEPVLPVPMDVVERTLPYMTPVVAAMAQMQLLCGMRPMEVCIMRPCDIDRSDTTWVYRPSKHKNAWRRHSLSKAIPQRAQAILTPFLDRAPEAYCFSPVESEAWRFENRPPYAGRERTTKVYPSELKAREKAKAKRKAAREAGKTKRPKNDCYKTDSYRRAIEYAIAAANADVRPPLDFVPHWHPHQLRHSISTEISQAIGEQAAQRWLGHASLSATGLYTERQVKELKEIAQQLDKRWAG